MYMSHVCTYVRVVYMNLGCVRVCMYEYDVQLAMQTSCT